MVGLHFLEAVDSLRVGRMARRAKRAVGDASHLGVVGLRTVGGAGGGKFAVCDKGWAEIDCGEATHDVVPIHDIWRFFSGEEFPA